MWNEFQRKAYFVSFHQKIHRTAERMAIIFPAPDPPLYPSRFIWYGSCMMTDNVSDCLITDVFNQHNWLVVDDKGTEELQRLCALWNDIRSASRNAKCRQKERTNCIKSMLLTAAFVSLPAISHSIRCTALSGSQPTDQWCVTILPWAESFGQSTAGKRLSSMHVWLLHLTYVEH